VIEHNVLVRQSIEEYRAGKASSSDYLIGGIAHHAGCADTVTFDHAPSGHARFTVLR
jgi:predicted nucleic-acid-binding protein